MRPLLLTALICALSCGRVVDDFGNEAPVANAGADRTASPGELLVFDGGSSSDVDGEIVSYQWSFPGGDKVDGVVVERAFDEGVHVVTLEVADELGAIGRAEILVDVAYSGPSASFTQSAELIEVGETVNFDASSSTAEVDIARYQWSFGDGAVAEGVSASHRYTSSGSFNVRLVVEDAGGRRADVQSSVDVGALDVDGDYDLVFERTSFTCAEYIAQFDESELNIARTGEDIALRFGSGLTMNGREIDGRVSASQTWVAPTGGECIQAPVDGTASLTFDGDSFEGSVSLFFDLAVPCQCSAIFGVSGTRR